MLLEGKLDVSIVYSLACLRCRGGGGGGQPTEIRAPLILYSQSKWMFAY